MQREQLYETSHTLALNSHEIPSFIDVTDYDETMKDRAWMNIWETFYEPVFVLRVRLIDIIMKLEVLLPSSLEGT